MSLNLRKQKQEKLCLHAYEMRLKERKSRDSKIMTHLPTKTPAMTYSEVK